MNLNALATDYALNAEQPFTRATTTIAQTYYLTDPQGNRLTDPQGNYLVGLNSDTITSWSLNALASDNFLNAE